MMVVNAMLMLMFLALIGAMVALARIHDEM